MSEGSELYRRYVLPDDSWDGINRQVWEGTSWIVNAYSGSHSQPNNRYRAMGEWCRDRLGMEAFPFGRNPRPGRWRSGNATVFGWTWFGFSTEAEMQEFVAAWPAPEGVEAAA